ncbi:hypothetical protein ACF1A9_10805 [Streptomyces sp. NPDC014872]|uniref:hypothetical protein n=1 Tax=Streptomyces sp. NPDC014872 TaxID=3364926 RepID=UPI0036FB88FF
MAETRPHITVGHHDQYGVVAATSHDNHVAEHILRHVGFERLPGSTLYGLTDPQRDPVRRGAQAVQSLRAAQYKVKADVAYDLQPHTRLGTGRGLLERLEKPSASTVTPSAQQRRSQAAAAISPARAGAPRARPAAGVEYRPAPSAPQPVRSR